MNRWIETDAAKGAEWVDLFHDTVALVVYGGAAFPPHRYHERVALKLSDGAGFALSRFDSSFEGIGHVLRDRLLAVPTYQRAYAWRMEHVAQFWSDLRAALAAPDPEYFLGAIVLTPSTGRMHVIDGQQRLATAGMLVAAIRDYFVRVGEATFAEEIERKYLTSLNFATGQKEARLVLSSKDAAYFARTVAMTTGDDAPVAEFQSNTRIREAFEYLAAEIRNDAEAAGPNWSKRLIEWIEFLDGSVHVIVVSAASDADAFLIFETLNDRGLPLSTADLLKNYLISLVDPRLSDAERAWSRAVAVFEGSAEEELFTMFLRHFWGSMHGATRERELYRRMRSEVHSQAQSLALLDRLEAAAPLYAALLDPSHGEWVRLGVADSNVVRTLLGLRLEQYRPLLLAAMEELDGSELLRLLRALISWSVRGLIVGGIGGGLTERYYSLAAVAVRRREATSVHAIYDRLRPILPSDDQFISAFATRRVRNLRFVMYLLNSLEKHVNREERPDVVANGEPNVIVDRILPLRPQGEAWPHFDVSEATSWALRLGNAVLVEKDVSQEPLLSFERKRSAYAKSGLRLTREIASQDVWSPEGVASRQSRLATLARDVWPSRPIV